jgi:hypothetical protein
MKTMRGLRYANIGLAVMMVLSVVGFILFRGVGEGAVQASVWFSVCVGGAVYIGLSMRADRRRGRRDQ